MTATRAPEQLAPGLHRLGTDIVNWYLVEGDDGFTAVDAGLPGFAQDLDERLKQIGVRRGDVRAVVLTHSDADHTGLANAFREAGARVLIGAGDADTLARPRQKGGDASAVNAIRELWRPQLWRTFIHMARGGGARPPAVAGAETFGDGDTLDVPGRPRAIHTPGHTPGHCALVFEGAGAVFVGDAMCTWNPFTGARGPQPMPRMTNVDDAQARASIARLAGVDVPLLLPGHGEPWREGSARAVQAARERAGS